MIKNLIKSIFISLSLLTFASSFCNTNYKELMLIIDYHKAETIYHTLTNKNKDGLPQGCGAITLGALAAFEQEAAPIVLSKDLWENIFAHAQVYQDFCNLNSSNLVNKYKNFARFDSIQLINQFKQICVYFKNIYPQIEQEITNLVKNNKPEHIQQVFLNITNNKKFSYNSAPRSLTNYHTDPNTRDKYTDAVIFFICNHIVNKVKNWYIKEIDNNISLFLPKNYLNKLNITEKEILEVAQDNSLTKTEYKLGLKVNHFKNIDHKCNVALKPNAVAGIEVDRSVKFVPVLEKLFVNNCEYSKIYTTSPKWILYLDGHGLSSYSIKKELRKFKKIKNHYEQVLNKRFKCCYKAEQNNTISSHLQKCSLSYEYQQIRPTINQINNSINTIEKHLKNNTNPLEGTILSLPVSEFKKVLSFLNSQVNTEFIYYSSCFAGGEHLVVPYRDTNSNPIKFNYYITVGTLSENISQLEVPSIPLPPYRDYQMNCYTVDPEESIDIKNKKLKFYTALDFNSFFELIKADKHKDKKEIAKVIASVNPYTYKNGQLKKSCLGNLPCVRRPQEDNFVFVTGSQKFALISNSKPNTTKTISNNCDIILLGDKNIQSKIVINKIKKDTIPAIVSIIPGEAAHDIEILDARQFTLAEVVNAFSQLPNFAASKLFKIKKLIVKSCQELSSISNSRGTVTLDNFIISHKVHDTNNINEMKKCLSITMPTPNELITGIFFGIKNAVYSIPWAGRQIRNLLPKPASKKKQNMLLAYHEELSERPILG